MSELKGTRVVLADDHDRVRGGVRALLEDSGLEVVAEGKNADEAQRLILSAQPELLLLDFSMPGPSVSETLEFLRAHAPGTRVLILTAHDDDAFVSEALQAGVDGYILKEEAPEHLLEAVRDVLAGQGWFSPLLKQKFAL